MLNISFHILIKSFCIIFLCFFPYNFFSQACSVTSHPIPGCNEVRIVDLSPQESQPEFIFDSFAKWNSGITFYGWTTLKIVAKDDTITPSAPPCFWNLLVQVDNLSSPGDEWDTEDSYGSTNGNKPEINMLRVSFDNGCHTPQNAGSWQTFSSNLDIIPIIQPTGGNVVADGTSACSAGANNETNSAGSYLSPEYNEFTFRVDYKIVPQVGQIPGLTPGRYKLLLKFCIAEN